MSRLRSAARVAGAVLVAAALVAASSGCGADDSPALGASGGDGGLAVRSASVTEGASIAAGYLVVEGGDSSDLLVGVSSPAAAAVSLHRTDASGAMLTAEAIEVPAGTNVTFIPGGDHLMLEGLVAPLLPGDSVPLDLEFAEAGVVRVDAPVVALVDVLDVYGGGW